MCMSCGCKQPNEDHGDDRNITMKDFQRAAEAAGIDVQGVMKNFQESFSPVSAGTSSGSGPVATQYQTER
jgi:hypothetical protein